MGYFSNFVIIVVAVASINIIINKSVQIIQDKVCPQRRRQHREFPQVFATEVPGELLRGDDLKC